jgi:mono/diheme cytochrome c family protein
LSFEEDPSATDLELLVLGKKAGEKACEHRSFFGGTRQANCGGHMRRMFFRLTLASIFIGLGILVPSSGARAQSDAAKVYKTNCVLCHAADGSGSTASGKAMNAKDLRSPEVQGKSDAELAEFITQGKGKMPAFGKKLKPDNIKQLVAYIREMAAKK